MGFIGWIDLGLMVGAMVGGWIGDLLFGGGKMEFWNLSSWILAIVGGLVVAGNYDAITGRSKTTA